MIANLAAIFHWPLSELRALDIDELIDWNDRAIRWWNRYRAEKG